MKSTSRELNFCPKTIVFALMLVSAAGWHACAQSTLPNAPEPQPEATLRNSPANVLHDQAVIWTSPARFRTSDLDWFIPLAGATGLAIATDHDAMVHVVPRNASLNQTSTNASNALTGAFIATPAALFGWGALKQNERARESGILGAEAMIDGVVVEQGMKLIFWRERPAVDNAQGKFFQTSAGADSSFPSTHNVVAWSAAAVLAGEYPSGLNRLLIYSAASGVSLTRVIGQQHFPSDVIVGATAGWLVGHYVFHKHHNRTLDDLDEDNQN